MNWDRTFMEWTEEESRWRSQSACAGMDPNIFYPLRGELADSAKSVCATCEVSAQCLDYALTHGERHGIWGGYSELGRRRLRRNRRIRLMKEETNA